jgi:hypothetical protein
VVFYMDDRGCVASGKCVMSSRSVFLASTIEEKGYEFFFLDGQVFFMPRGSRSNILVGLGVRNTNVYR